MEIMFSPSEHTEMLRLLFMVRHSLSEIYKTATIMLCPHLIRIHFWCAMKFDSEV